MPVDPDTLEFDEDDDWMYRNDAVRERLEANMLDQAWHLRALMRHAAEMLEDMLGFAKSGDVDSARHMITSRRPLVEALVATLSAWEVAACAFEDRHPGSLGITSEIVERWLAEPNLSALMEANVAAEARPVRQTDHSHDS